jgi:hypothetical protein
MLQVPVDRSRATKTSAAKALGAVLQKPATAFDRAFEKWQAAQAGWKELETIPSLPEAAFDRLTDKRAGARERATEKLASTPARNAKQLTAKIDALWDILHGDFKEPAHALMQCVEHEHLALLKGIREDVKQLANGTADPMNIASRSYSKARIADVRSGLALDDAEGTARAGQVIRNLPALREAAKKAGRAERVALRKMIRTTPTTPHGAGLLALHIARDIEMGAAEWHADALSRLGSALLSM